MKVPSAYVWYATTQQKFYVRPHLKTVLKVGDKNKLVKHQIKSSPRGKNTKQNTIL